MALLADVGPRYIRIRILLLLSLVVVVGLVSLLSSLLDDAGALLVGVGIAVVAASVLVAAYAGRR